MTFGPSITLEAVEQQFISWRASKKSGEKIPEYLWSLIRQLVGQYKLSHITTRLKISTKQMKREGLHNGSVVNRSDKVISDPFIQVKLPTSLAPHCAMAPPILTIERPDGFTLSLHNPTGHKLNEWMTIFLGK